MVSSDEKAMKKKIIENWGSTNIFEGGTKAWHHQLFLSCMIEWTDSQSIGTHSSMRGILRLHAQLESINCQL